MYVIFLRFAENKQNAPRFMDGHKAWIEQGFERGLFLSVGSLASGGGMIMAPNVDQKTLEDFLKEDPFVEEKIVTIDIEEVSINRADSRLLFLID